MPTAPAPPASHPHRARGAALALVLVLVLAIVYFPVFLGDVLFQRDVGRWLYPAFWFVRESLRLGDWPFWNPHIGLGFPAIANPLYGLFYPPNWLLWLFDPLSAVTWSLWAHLASGALGSFFLARALGARSGVAPVVAGLAWGLSGYPTSGTTTGLLLITGSYFSWTALGLLSLDRAFCAGGWRRALATLPSSVLPAALAFLSGEIFLALLALMFALLVVIAAEAPAGDPGRRRRWGARLLVLGSAAGAAVALAAVSIVPAWAAAAGTRAEALPLAQAEVGSLHPLRLIELVAPGAMGDPYADYVAAPWVGEMMERPLLYGVYAGASVVVLALAAFSRARLPWVLGGGAMGALLLALGRHTPAHAVFRFIVRPFSFMRGPEKYLVVVTSALALLAGLGTERLRAERSGRRWAYGAGAVLVTLLLATLPGLVPLPLVATVRRGALHGLAAATATIGCAWVARRRPVLGTCLLAVLVVADLSPAVWSLQSFGPRALFAEPEAAKIVKATVKMTTHTAANVEPPRVFRLPSIDDFIGRVAPPRSVSEVQANLTRTLIDNTAITFQLDTVPGYDAAVPEAFKALWAGASGLGVSLWRFAGVTHLLVPDDPALRPPVGLQDAGSVPPAGRLYRVTEPLPRVFWTGRARHTRMNRQSWPTLFDPDVLAGRVALVDDAALAAQLAVPSPGVSGDSGPVRGTCRSIERGNNRVVATCTAPAPGLAVFNEQHEIGWHASIDGQPARLVPANGTMMRAVPVPAGTHRVDLTYVPRGLLAGVTISVSALFCLLAAGLLAGQRKK